jgi:hypothetical protein
LKTHHPGETLALRLLIEDVVDLVHDHFGPSGQTNFLVSARMVGDREC